MHFFVYKSGFLWYIEPVRKPQINHSMKKEIKCVSLQNKISKCGNYSALTLNCNYKIEKYGMERYKIRDDHEEVRWYPGENFLEVNCSDIASLQAEFDNAKKNLDDLETRLKKAKDEAESKNVIKSVVLESFCNVHKINKICEVLCDALGEPNMNLHITATGDLKEKSLYLPSNYIWTIVDNKYLMIEKK